MKEKFTKMANYFLGLAVECMLFAILYDTKKVPKCEKEIEQVWKKNK